MPFIARRTRGGFSDRAGDLTRKQEDEKGGIPILISPWTIDAAATSPRMAREAGEEKATERVDRDGRGRRGRAGRRECSTLAGMKTRHGEGSAQLALAHERTPAHNELRGRGRAGARRGAARGG